MHAIVYDIEIKKAILGKNESFIPNIEYCRGWQDHANMGVSVIGAYDYRDDRYRVFCDDNFDEFRRLCEDAELLIGFNNVGFDNKVLRACLGIDLDTKLYDLLSEIWIASGLSASFEYPTHTGFGLEAVSLANGGTPKTGNGALAPVLWRQGKIGQVIDYCLEDVRLTRRLIDLLRHQDYLKCPKTGAMLSVRKPF